MIATRNNPAQPIKTPLVIIIINAKIKCEEIVQNNAGMEITMSLFKRNATKKEIESSLNEIQINLENNYKDLAIKAFKDSSELIEKYHNTAVINEKTYIKYKQQLDEFSKRMVGYSHRLNVKY